MRSAVDAPDKRAHSARAENPSWDASLPERILNATSWRIVCKNRYCATSLGRQDRLTGAYGRIFGDAITRLPVNVSLPSVS